MAHGGHSQDAELFSEKWHAPLRSAAADLSWLLTRGYAPDSSLKIVGDRYRLQVRQRLAVARSACSDQARDHRMARQVRISEPLLIDGFNCLITVEAALAGGLIIRGRDGAFRDLASVHGSYARSAVTSGAIDAIRKTLEGLSKITWLLDRPVSNSGRLGQLLQEHWTVELVNSPDAQLVRSDAVVASSDSWVIDRCRRWVDLPAAVIAAQVPQAWILDLAPA